MSWKGNSKQNCLRAFLFFSIEETSLQKVMRPRPVVFIVTREVGVPKKVKQTREVLPNLVQWEVGQGYVSFGENTLINQISVVVY